MRIPFLFLSALATLSLVSCGNSGPKGAAIRDGDVVFTKTPYVDLSALPERLNLEVEVTGKITRLQVGTQVLLNENSGKYSYAKGILTIDTSAFKDKDGELLIGPGDQPIRIYADTTVTTSCLFVSKVIKTAEDLVAINQGGSAALQGAYILGNDIDCSSIANFEPLGYSDTDDGTHYNEQFNGIFDTVKSCMDDPTMREHVRKCVFEEIIPTLDLPREELVNYANSVLVRFSNPYIKHYLSSIALNSVSKFKVRVLPSILESKKRFGTYPPTLTFAFAKLIEFYKKGTPNDDPAAVAFLQTHTTREILANKSLWGTDLTDLAEAVERYANS